MIQIHRKLPPGDYKLSDVFSDIKQHPILEEIFESSEEIEDVLSKTKVVISDKPRYMKVDNENGSVLIGQNHIRHSEAVILYLDIIHELVHVKQHRQGMDLYDRSKSYVDRQTEVDAYALTVKEAKRIGLTDKEIFDYLNVEWITPEEHLQLAKKLKISF